jgi:hypothetical protein
MHTFSLQDPGTKGSLYEWYFHELLKQEGFVGLQYQFVEFNNNNRFKGVYALEQSFDSALLTSNHQVNSPILKFDKNILIDQSLLNNTLKKYSDNDLFHIANIEVFRQKKVFKDSVLTEQFLLAQTMLNEYRNEQASLDETFDLNATAKLFALIDLAGAQHGLMWKNIRFYYDADINKVALIAYDAASGWPFDDIMHNRWRLDLYYGIYADSWFSLFFKDEAFVSQYLHWLSYYYDPKFLSSFFENTFEKAELWKSCLVEDLSYRGNYKQYFTQNSSLIRKKIKVITNLNDSIEQYLIKVNVTTSENGKKSIISLKNNSFKKLHVFAIYSQGKLVSRYSSTLLINNRQVNQPTNTIKIGEVSTKFTSFDVGILTDKRDTLWLPFPLP